MRQGNQSKFGVHTKRGKIKMNTILSYIDSVFNDLPQSTEMQRLKDEMSVKMIDRYRRLLDEGKTENESVGIVLQELGDVDDWLVSGAGSFEIEKTDYQTPLTLTNAEVDEYIQHRAKYSIAIASGVMMCILAPAFMMLTLDMYKWLPFLGEESVVGETLAVFLLFIFVAIAVYYLLYMD